MTFRWNFKIKTYKLLHQYYYTTNHTQARLISARPYILIIAKLFIYDHNKLYIYVI